MAGGQEHLLASGALDPEVRRIRVYVLYAEKQKTSNRIAAVDRASGVGRISMCEEESEKERVRNVARLTEENSNSRMQIRQKMRLLRRLKS